MLLLGHWWQCLFACAYRLLRRWQERGRLTSLVTASSVIDNIYNSYHL